MKKSLSLLSLLVVFVLTLQAQDKKVAVFDPVGSVPKSTKEIVREEISTVVVNTKGYKVLERSLIDKVLEENKFQMGGLVDEGQISEIGKMMGANYALVTSITIMDNGSYYLSFKLIDVLTAGIEKQKTARTKSDELIDVVEKTAKEMFGGQVTTTVSTPSSTQTQNKPQQPASQPTNQQQPTQNNGISSFRGCGMEIMEKDLYENKFTLAEIKIPDGWRLPTRNELKCMCREKKKIENFNTKSFSNYFTSEYDSKGKVYIRSFDDCEENTENPEKEKGWVRLVR